MNTMKTFSTTPSHVEASWHVFDATGVVLGRLATKISVLLQGKHKPIYARHILTGDYVVVVNASRVRVTGAKTEQKMYRSHSHYPGALRETPLSSVLENHPDRVIREAVRGMLPKNTLGRHMLRRLRVYAGDTHPHGAQVKDKASDELLAAPPERPEAVETPAVEMMAEQAEAKPAEETIVEATAEQAENEAADETVAEASIEQAEVESAEETTVEASAEQAEAESADETIVEASAEQAENEAADETVAEASAEQAEVESAEETVAEASPEQASESDTNEEKR